MARRSRLAPKPQATTNTDQWVTQGGIDPELPAEKPKSYPHRISLDMETAQYKRLKRAAFEEERTMNEILREALEVWLDQNNH